MDFSQSPEFKDVDIATRLQHSEIRFRLLQLRVSLVNKDPELSIFIKKDIVNFLMEVSHSLMLSQKKIIIVID